MPGTTKVSIEIGDDLRKLSRALRSIQKDLPKEVTKVFKAEVDAVAVAIKSNMDADFGGNPRRKGDKVRAKSAIFKRASTGGATVGYFSKNRYVGWLDFGGTLKPAGKRRNTITRPVIKGGRYLYPAIKQQKPVAIPRLQKALDDLVRRYL